MPRHANLQDGGKGQKYRAMGTAAAAALPAPGVSSVTSRVAGTSSAVTATSTVKVLIKLFPMTTKQCIN